MAHVVLKRGTTQQLAQEELQDGLLAVTTDDGRIHIDYVDEKGELKRRTLYSGKLTIGSHVYDGTEDVSVTVYEGTVNN